MIFETKTKVDGKEISRTRKLGMLDLLTFTDEFEQKLSQSGYSIDTLAQQAGGDLSFLSYYGSYVESSNAEQAFTSALMTVTDPNPVYVSILTGRSELTQLTYFQTLLTANGYNVNTVDITSEDIPADTDVVVIPAPKTDYLAEDIKRSATSSIMTEILANSSSISLLMVRRTHRILMSSCQSMDFLSARALSAKAIQASIITRLA